MSNPLSDKALMLQDDFNRLNAEHKHLLDESERLLNESQQLRAGSERLRNDSDRLCASVRVVALARLRRTCSVGGGNQTMTDDYGDIINRMMRDLQEDDDNLSAAPRWLTLLKGRRRAVVPPRRPVASRSLVGRWRMEAKMR